MCTSTRSHGKNTEPAASKRAMNILKDILCFLFVQIHAIFDCFVDFAFGLYYDNLAKKVPPIRNDLLLCSASELAEKIRTKKLKAEDVVSAFIERSKEVNGIINAIVEERYAAALQEAKAVDEMLKDAYDSELMKKTKPFLGVPFTTKESNEAKGMIHSMGLLCRKDHRSQEDATAIRFMKEAGGILICKTNVPELNLWCESRNNLYGQTCNPYNTTRTVGGSSGGEGALAAACGTAIAVASDIGGSTRMPGFFNGCYAFKPSAGVTPLKGIGLRSEDYPNSMAEVGPICKKAEDLAPMMKVLAGDKISLLRLDSPVDVKDLKIFYQCSSGDMRSSKVNRAMRTALSRMVDHFKELTGSAIEVKIPGSQYSYRLWRFWMSTENLDFKLAITNGQYRASAKGELYKFLTGTSELTLAAIFKLADEDFFPKDDPDWAKRVTANMSKYLINKLGTNGVLFFPSAPTPATYHYASFLRPFNFGYTALFNVLKLPVCQVPMGLDENGLPVGVQVVAGPFNDHLCIAVAKEVERVFGGWIQPS